MLQTLDILLAIVHLIIIFFILLGWLWKDTRRLHFYSILVTADSWFGLGIWFGLGYCPITDWQWQVKGELGEQNLPASCIKDVVDRITGQYIDSSLLCMMNG